MSSHACRPFFDPALMPINADTITVRLYTAPVGTLPSGNMDGLTEVSGTGYARSGDDVSWTTSTITVTHAVLYDPSIPDRDGDDPYELDMTDATTTGIGDPLADVLRNIDELLEGQ